jgi:aspartate 1-decarboxylase
MLRKVCKGKLHRITVTEADLNYVGSITLDKKLMAAADIRPFEMVQITNVSNGMIWHTYAIEGQEGTGVVCLNGPPARHFQPGDKIIVLSLGWINEEEWETLEAHIVFVDDLNKITNIHIEKPNLPC